MISIEKGNIISYQVDAIVNATNSAFSGGGGVDTAIHRAAGSELMTECRKIGYHKQGEAVITKGYRLLSNYVIHVVAPVWYDGNKYEAEILYSCYSNALQIAGEHKLSTIAFPSISTGAYKFPLDKAAQIAINALSIESKKWVSIEKIYIICFDDKTMNAYKKANTKKNSIYQKLPN